MHTRRIARGARWLDKTHPGWHNQIDTYALAYTDNSCIIGQLHGSHNDYFMFRHWYMPKEETIDRAIDRGKLGYLWYLYLPLWFAVTKAIIASQWRGFFTGDIVTWADAWRGEIQARRQAERVPTWEEVDRIANQQHQRDTSRVS